jgi:dihydrofolate reductase
MPKLRVHNFSVSIDGYAAGPSQSLDEPLGVGGEQLHNWFFGTRTFHKVFGEEGGDEGVDDRFAAAGEEGLGATIMGRNMFGPIRGDWTDDEWKGWWGDNPPYHHPTFVLTHHPRESITMEGGTRGGVPDGRRAGRPARGRRLNHPAISARRSDR